MDVGGVGEGWSVGSAYLVFCENEILPRCMMGQIRIERQKFDIVIFLLLDVVYWGFE